MATEELAAPAEPATAGEAPAARAPEAAAPTLEAEAPSAELAAGMVAPAEPTAASGPTPGTAPAGSQPATEMPFCGHCGAQAVRFSNRGGWRETLLRAAGATLYRCHGCGRRFAFAPVGHRRRRRAATGENEHRHAHHGPAHRARREERQRRALRVFWTVAAALLSFVLAAYLIIRAERSYLDSGGGRTVPVQRR